MYLKLSISLAKFGSLYNLKSIPEASLKSKVNTSPLVRLIGGLIGAIL